MFQFYRRNEDYNYIRGEEVILTYVIVLDRVNGFSVTSAETDYDEVSCDTDN